jgi:hypothetical protein
LRHSSIVKWLDTDHFSDVLFRVPSSFNNKQTNCNQIRRRSDLALRYRITTAVLEWFMIVTSLTIQWPPLKSFLLNRTSDQILHSDFATVLLKTYTLINVTDISRYQIKSKKPNYIEFGERWPVLLFNMYIVRIYEDFVPFFVAFV